MEVGGEMEVFWGGGRPPTAAERPAVRLLSNLYCKCYDGQQQVHHRKQYHEKFCVAHVSTSCYFSPKSILPLGTGCSSLSLTAVRRTQTAGTGSLRGDSL